MRFVLVLLACLIALAAAQAFIPVWPTEEELSSVPRAYSGGYILNCLSAGLTGGCSGCVHGRQNACNWISISEEGLQSNQPSQLPFGGRRGVCVPRGLEAHREFVLTYYHRFWEELLEQYFGNEIVKRQFGQGIPAVIEVKNHICPKNVTKEPRFRGYGVSIGDSDAWSTHYESEFCAFPSSDGKWVVDRSTPFFSVPWPRLPWNPNPPPCTPPLHHGFICP